MLKSPDLHEHKRLCIQLRLCEKKILKKAHEFAVYEKTEVTNRLQNSKETSESAETRESEEVDVKPEQ